MNLITKTISCGLALSVALSGIYTATAEHRVRRQRFSSTSLNEKRTKSLITGGTISTITLLATVGVWNYVNRLPTLIIGGDKEKRAAIINKLKKRQPLNSSVCRSLTEIIEESIQKGTSVTAYGSNSAAEAIQSKRTKFSNWKISFCDSDDKDAPSVMKKARLVIAILDDKNSDDKIANLLRNYRTPGKCMVVEIWDENHIEDPASNQNDTLADCFNDLASTPKSLAIAKFFYQYQTPARSSRPKYKLDVRLLPGSLRLFWNQSANEFTIFDAPYAAN